MPKTSKVRTITLSNHPPVRIREDAWPVIAHGRFRSHDGGEHECRANRWWRADIRVRRHEDGRAIVYGVYDYFSTDARERDLVARAGMLVPTGADLVRAIHAAGSDLMRVTRDAARAAGDRTHDATSCAHIQIRSAVLDCIAALPAVDLA